MTKNNLKRVLQMNWEDGREIMTWLRILVSRNELGFSFEHFNTEQYLNQSTRVWLLCCW